MAQTQNPNDDFPIVWEDSADKDIFFHHEQTYYPGQIKPLDFTLNINLSAMGFNKAAKAYSLPLQIQIQHVNTYVYKAFTPLDNTSAEDTLSLQTKIQNNINDLHVLWTDTWFPEIKEHLAYWQGFNFNDATSSRLLAHLNETEKRALRVWEIHFLLFFPTIVVLDNFQEQYQDLFNPSNQFEGYDLLTGIESQMIKMSRELWQLSHRVRAIPAVYNILVETPSAEVYAKLEKNPKAAPFLSEFNAYLGKYGKCSAKVCLTDPFWIEDPTPVLKNLKEYILNPMSNALAKFDERIKRREERLIQTRAGLKNYPELIVTQFVAHLKAAQIANFLHEEHAFWIEGQVNYKIRHVCLALGTFLMGQGVLDNVEDIFYFTLPELKTILAKDLLDVNGARALFEKHKAAEARFATVTPPATLGIPPTHQDKPDNLIMRAMTKKLSQPITQDATSDQLQGYAGAPGVVKGKAKVVLSLTEAEKLEAGDILVTKTTISSWTPFFASIAGLVTDSGGILSHAAIVAREYNIPTVVGVGVATSVIKDGQIIEVNGDTGFICILSKEN